jgi:hypothetical protein
MCKKEGKTGGCGGGCVGCPGKKNRHDVIRHNAAYLAQQIRDYCTSQVKTWQKVPRLALEAGAHGDDADDYHHAFQGLWTIRVRDCKMFIVLRSGELYSTFARNEVRPAEDEEVLLLASHLDLLDAAALVARLEAEVLAPRACDDATSEQDAGGMSSGTKSDNKSVVAEAGGRLVDPFELAPPFNFNGC